MYIRKKLVLEDINRNREIMGLGRLLTEQEKEKGTEVINELIEVFKSTPKEERERT